MTWVLLLAALGAWAAGAAVDLALGPGRPLVRTVPYLAGAAGGACLCAAGVLAVLGSSRLEDLGPILGMGRTVVYLDGVSGLFLTLGGALAACISACMVSWGRFGRRTDRRGIAAGYLLLLGSVSVILVAADAFTFLFAWESLTLAFYVLVGVKRRSKRDAGAAWLTLGVGKLGGAALLFGFLLLAARTGSYQFSAWHQLASGGARDAAYALIVLGFAAKVGIVPLQVWMPRAYPAPPGPTRAALAGLAANVGFYGLWRFLGILGRPSVWLAVVVLLAGGFTALLGITFAGVESRMDRLIAYSSVENAGLILVGYGIALSGAATANSTLTALGILAASLQVLTHAVAKTELFCAASFFCDDWRSEQLDDLRGVGHTHRWAGTGFALGALALSGLPLTIGFASEWFLLESLMQEFRLAPLELRLAMGAAGALVALTAGIAALTFVRLIGLTVLGRPAGPLPDRSLVNDGRVLGRVGLALLGLSLVGLAAAIPWVVRYLADGLRPVVPRRAVLDALKSPWVLQPVYKDFSILSPSWLAVVMPVAFLAVTALAIALSRGRFLRVRRVPAWRSATAGVTGADRYSSFGYANVLRHVLGNVLGSRTETIVVFDESDVGIVEATHVEVRAVVVEPVETYLYRPARRAFLRIAAAARKLQSGRLDAYIAYMLGALIVVMVVVAVL